MEDIRVHLHQLNDTSLIEGDLKASSSCISNVLQVLSFFNLSFFSLTIFSTVSIV